METTNDKKKENPRKLYECKVCGWTWFPRTHTEHPRICPHCKSTFWEEGRQRAPRGTNPRQKKDT